jgi:hypothetical protein
MVNHYSLFTIHYSPFTKMKTLISIIALLFSFTTFASAQENKCTLKLSQLKQAPELYGLRIGMTLDQVKALVPSLQPGQTDDLGFATTSFSPDFNPQIDKTVYAGVRTVSLEFLDGKLFVIWIGYTKSYKWKTLDEFVPGMSTALGLPIGPWSANSSKPLVECSDFDITASMIGGGPSIRITDRTAKELWEQRRTEKEEKRSEQDELK